MVVAFSLVATNAQDIKFGAKAGLNIANLTGDTDSSIDSRIAFHAGAVAEFLISEKFSVQPELLFSAQGAKNEYTEEGNVVKSTMKLNYLNLPIMAKYYVIKGLSLEAGPEIGMKLSAKTKAEANGVSATVDIGDNIENIAFGLNLGAGYKLDNGLNFNIRYNLGLSNIAKGSDNDDSSVKNSVFQVSVGYFFN